MRPIGEERNTVSKALPFSSVISLRKYCSMRELELCSDWEMSQKTRRIVYLWCSFSSVNTAWRTRKRYQLRRTQEQFRSQLHWGFVSISCEFTKCKMHVSSGTCHFRTHCGHSMANTYKDKCVEILKNSHVDDLESLLLSSVIELDSTMNLYDAFQVSSLYTKISIHIRLTR
jgi:hypothetical protein